MDWVTVGLLVAGALTAGFINGFAGFGTALVASGFWFLVLPAHVVPPLIILAALAGQVVGLWKLSGRMDFRLSIYLISGGVLGVPVGALLLSVLDPNVVKTTIGWFLIAYALFQLKGLPAAMVSAPEDGFADRSIGFVGGVLGGFAGLSGVLPLIWLQLKRLSPADQRARYQPFNLFILMLSAVAMVALGKVDTELMAYAGVAIPFSLLGAVVGANMFLSISEKGFQRAVLVLLMLSGCFIVSQSLM
ncbi:sulfite exporter TauE/SafE family protein [Falsiruegeria litorea]|nr:sulfite exporter TauE/SafE family protein [Falsiruegeria litorea]